MRGAGYTTGNKSALLHSWRRRRLDMGIRDVEDGNFTRIHNEIIEQLALRKFTVYEHQCLWFLFRKTYGYGQKEDAISLSQWVKGTGIKKQNIAVVLNKLVERRVINRTKARGRGRVSIY